MNSNETDDLKLLNAAAAASGEVSFIQSVLYCGARVTDSWPTEALHYIENGRCTSLVLQRLLVDFRGNAPTAVAFTCFINRADSLQLILAAGASPLGVPEQPDEGWCRHDPARPNYTRGWIRYRFHEPQSALELAVVGNNKSCLNVLVESYALAPELVGRALALVIFFGRSDLIEDLYKLDLDVDAEGSSYKSTLADYDEEHRSIHVDNP